MPLLLTTPIDVGEADVQDYTHLKITKFAMDLETGSFQIELVPGYLVDGNFTAGVVRDTRALQSVNGTFSVSGQDFVDFFIAHATEYNAVRDGLYQWVIDNIRSGTIV